MAGQAHEVRWSNDSKRWGLFAKATIPIGTKIYREMAVMNDLRPLNEVIVAWQSAKTLDQTMKAVLEVETSKISNGMQALEKMVRNDQNHAAAMRIHVERMVTAEEEEEEKTQAAAGHVPRLSVPMSLYKQTVNSTSPESEEFVASLLQRPLRKINTFYEGFAALTYPTTHAWGPQSSLLNHGCKPTAAIACYRTPYSAENEPSNIGVVSVHALREIKEGEEITIAYAPVFGTRTQRQQQVRDQANIASCECEDCEHEQILARDIGNETSQAMLGQLNEISECLYIMFSATPPVLPTLLTWHPAAFYQKFFQTLSQFFPYHYHGTMWMHLYTVAITFAKNYNDNMRVHWLTGQLLGHIETAYSSDHALYRSATNDFYRSLEGHVWNESTRDQLSIVPETFETEQEDRNVMFMIDHDVNSPTHHHLTLSPSGRLTEISSTENHALVLGFQVTRMAKQEAEQARRAAAIATAAASAESAAAALTAEEESKTEKKEKERARAKAKKARRAERKVKEEEELAAAEAAVVARLEERRAAVLAAAVVPALPLPAKAAEKEEEKKEEVKEEEVEVMEKEEDEEDEEEEEELAVAVPVVAAPVAVVVAVAVPVVVVEEGPPHHHHRFRSVSAPSLWYGEEEEEEQAYKLRVWRYVDDE